MGLMRFLVPPPEKITEEMLDLAYLSGMDRTPWPVRSRTEGEQLLVLERDVSESGSLTIPWKVERHGILGLSSATLLERPEPYLLVLELARGTISQLRNQFADWQAINLTAPTEALQGLREATEQFGRAAVNAAEPAAAAAHAQAALRTAVDASRALAAAYAEQVLAARRRATPKLATLLGVELFGPLPDDAEARQFLAAFNAALVPVAWREIEASEGTFDWSATDQRIDWCRSRGLKIVAGPLIHFDTRALPDWVYLWEEDLENLLDAVSEFVRAAVERYRGKVDLWLGAARMNASEALSLSEEEKLRLAAGVLHLVNNLDADTPTVLSVEQPWGEYMARRPVDFPPLHFADVLARAGLNLKALMLEMNLGYGQGATLPRMELELNRQLDYWGLLGLPLLVSLTAPSGSQEDAMAQRRVRLPPQCATLQTQQAWIARYVPLMLAKTSVYGVFWNQFRDNEPHEFPHAGLLDSQGRPKPSLRALAGIRAIHLR